MIQHAVHICQSLVVNKRNTFFFINTLIQLNITDFFYEKNIFYYTFVRGKIREYTENSIFPIGHKYIKIQIT